MAGPISCGGKSRALPWTHQCCLEVRERVELCHLLKEAPSKISDANRIPGVKGGRFRVTMRQLASQLESQVQKGILCWFTSDSSLLVNLWPT